MFYFLQFKTTQRLVRFIYLKLLLVNMNMSIFYFPEILLVLKRIFSIVFLYDFVCYLSTTFFMMKLCDKISNILKLNIDQTSINATKLFKRIIHT